LYIENNSLALHQKLDKVENNTESLCIPQSSYFINDIVK